VIEGSQVRDSDLRPGRISLIEAAAAPRSVSPLRSALLANLPNFITLARLMAVPLAIWLMLDARFGVAFWVFVAAGISDALDGYIAKRFDCQTRLGALLDPVADKALLSSVFVTLGLAGELPNWLVILVVFRDVMIIGGFLLVVAIGSSPQQFGPLLVSKVNTFMQVALAGFVLARLGLGADETLATHILIVLAALTTAASGLSYLVRWARILGRSETTL
jgi:cardiolipin synthase (CMP-forming)